MQRFLLVFARRKCVSVHQGVFFTHSKFHPTIFISWSISFIAPTQNSIRNSSIWPSPFEPHPFLGLFYTVGCALFEKFSRHNPVACTNRSQYIYFKNYIFQKKNSTENWLKAKVNVVQIQKNWYPRTQLTEIHQHLKCNFSNINCRKAFRLIWVSNFYGHTQPVF